ncbi:undecaprenyl-diphosphate phosphatase [Sinimarinibacterium sp. NLF-5-8]|uniref:undecaprenyl-diphosphate phosphatase n=1 Tax=Sinimarinibacterium sp. NLF-5-8 TaxID=2698684 RepID=UPI00137C177B|nr:undecaprenyl-diphosphate phosphatase [Sinimarinibacterium sp. NLF-5-8]QHS10654.1 undecaprenyl-diphosphate phosphatase [Sinimarinibacterium sp. NLF-5-8]
MDSLLQAILLGIIEGITEFLPISSTGHLLIAQHWLERRSDLFNIAIQAGAIIAVTLVYRQRLWQLASQWRSDRDTRDWLFKLITAFFITGVLGLIVKKLGVELPENVAPVAWALIIGGGVIFAVEAWVKRQPVVENVTWTVAIAVGVAQIIAGVFPGTSRSAAAIFAALLFGLTHRARAAEFAFIVGIPTMFAASGYELAKTLMSDSASVNESWLELGVACGVSALVGFAAVKWLLRYISGHSFEWFGVYRIVLGIGLLAFVTD